MNPQELPIRDIHLPPPIDGSLAPGWWLLLLVVLLVLAAFLWLRRRKVPRATTVNLALQELEQLTVQYGADNTRLIRELSVLLRRVAISQCGRQKIAGLTGSAWIDFLDRQVGKRLFSGRFDTALTEWPYRPEMPGEAVALLGAVREWISSQRGDCYA